VRTPPAWTVVGAECLVIERSAVGATTVVVVVDVLLLVLGSDDSVETVALLVSF
jgi:hypothetical protein